MRNLLIALFITVIFISCDSKWQMRTKTTEALYYHCGSSYTLNTRTEDWVFEGTKSEAEDKCGTKYFDVFESPYCIQRTITINLVGTVKD